MLLTKKRNYIIQSHTFSWTISEKFVDLQEEQAAIQVNAAWLEHIHIIRGNPV